MTPFAFDKATGIIRVMAIAQDMCFHKLSPGEIVKSED